MIPETTIVDVHELSDGDQTVVLRKLQTPNGERLAVSSADESVRLDALALESLTWQSDEFFAGVAGRSRDADTGPSDDEDAATIGEEREFQIGNEYTTIQLWLGDTAAGPRLRVTSHKLGYERLLAPADLAAIAAQPIEFFSELLRTPLGPEPVTEHDAP